MRRLRILLALVTGCGAGGGRAESAAEPIPLADFAWLEGSWRATDGERTTDETWIPLSDGAWLGFNRTLVGGQTRGYELLRLSRTSSGIQLLAAPSGQATTSFALTRVSASEALFENPEHDFPRWVRYERDGDRLIASIGERLGEPAASWRYEAMPEPPLVEIDGRVCLEEGSLSVALHPCYCAAALYCAAFENENGVDVHLALTRGTCGACAEVGGSCEIPDPPPRSLNGRALEPISGCRDVRLQLPVWRSDG